MLDREKPINLFLTIKKRLFEDLKMSAENFSNKLLNKFFGNEENEEESNQDYITNIKPNDINITKFNSIHDYKSSFNKGESFMLYFVQLIVFFVIFEIYIILKNIYTRNHFSNVLKFIDIYNTTQISHTLTIGRLNVIKQYFFNISLTNFNLDKNNNKYAFNQAFYDISINLANTIYIQFIFLQYLMHFFKKDTKIYLESIFIKIFHLFLKKINQIIIL